ncbi:MAG: leucine-rich repeat domain-containing protein [Clostridium sp.]|nr:leucine-rich repeat domain-containing protein [Clostridium sp.]
MKKRMVLWMLLLLIVCGGNARAADLAANEILDRAEAAMKEVNVVVICTKEGEETAMDRNTGVMHIEYGAYGDTWLDTKAKVSYIADGERYYFLPETDVQEINKENVDLFADVDRTLNYTCDGIQNYAIKGEDIACYKLSASHSQTGFRRIVYYINRDTYRIVAVEESVNNVVTAASWYDYPKEALTVPKEIKDTALLMPGYMFLKKKIVYTVVEENNTRMLYVADGSLAKGNVKIPDTVKLFGESYEVRYVDEDAFYNNRKIKSVTLGRNIRGIGETAFYGCKKLSKVTIQSKKLTKIGKKAFYKNAKTLRFKVPKGKKVKYKKMIQKSGIGVNYVLELL